MNCISCCFRSNPEDDERRPSLIRSSSTWIRSKAQDFPEIKDKCKTLISRMGRHRKNQSADFKYDPLSYALNFDEGGEDLSMINEDELKYRNFSARLPVSPPEPRATSALDSGFR